MNTTPLVKICGITRVKDAILAEELGANMIGLIFVPSPRRVALQTAIEIRKKVHKAKLVGVFADVGTDVISNTVLRAGLDGVQLHGSETSEEIDRLKLRHPNLIVIKTILPGQEANHLTCDFLLFDSIKGQESSYEKKLPMANKPFFLAGGLTPENVVGEIARFRPFGVDVARGTELSPGKKSVVKLKSFFNAVSSSVGA